MSRYCCTTSPRAAPNTTPSTANASAASLPRGWVSRPAETDTVAWLIRHHLLMSETAQMRDLNDFKTILDFANVVQSPERLKLLLILTVVDIRAVGPGVWNGWKGQLLRTLYWETEPILSGGHTAVSRGDRVREAQALFASRVRDWPAGEIEAYLARHYDAYWITVDVDRQLEQAQARQASHCRRPVDRHGDRHR